MSHPSTKNTLVLLLSLMTFIAWAAFFEIDQSVRATGQVIPSTHTQLIQVADGGVLSDILVQEGQGVEAGQVLAVLEKDRSHAAFAESQAKVAALQATLIRASADADLKRPNFSAIAAQYPQFAQAQMALHLQKRQSLNQELHVLEENLRMARQEHEVSEALYKTGDLSQLEVLRSERQLLDMQGRIQASRNKYLQDARQEALRTEEELSSSRYKLDERKNILEHTNITAPVTGIVKSLKINTIGGVLRNGDELMQISPTEGQMVIEAKVNPVDIGQLHVGLPVNLKLDAYDYSIYGTLEGTLVHIGSDTLTDPVASGPAPSYYRIHVQPQSTPGMHKLTLAMLKPGMTASLDIRTNRRSVLNYLLKPLYKSLDGALNER
jgi:membrane fusion protein, adhesin transport system